MEFIKKLQREISYLQTERNTEERKEMELRLRKQIKFIRELKHIATLSGQRRHNKEQLESSK